MIFNDTVMADVVTAPQYYVVANRGKRLNRVIFQNKAIITDSCARKDRSLGTHIADQKITFSFDPLVNRLANGVHPAMGHRCKKRMIRSRINSFDLLKR